MSEKAVIAKYKSYIEAFQDKNYNLIGEFCRVPFFSTSPIGTTIFQNTNDIVSGFSSMRESLDLEDYRFSRLNKLDFIPLSKQTSLLKVDFDRINSNGDAYHNGNATYVFHSEENDFKISGIIVSDKKTTSKWAEN